MVILDGNLTLNVAQKSRRTVWQLVSSMTMSAVLVLGGHSPFASASTCVATTETTTSDRIVDLSFTGCTGVRSIQISENPDFLAAAGVTVTLESEAADSTGAVVSVDYQNSSYPPGSGAIAYSQVAEPATVKTLTVLFEFVDENGDTAGLPAYETPTWAHRLVFGDGVIGHEGLYHGNSFADHVWQSSEGAVEITGATHPTVVQLPLATFRDFLNQPADIKTEVLAAIEAQNPGYLDAGGFEFYLFLSSDFYAVDRGLYSLGSDHVIYALPYDPQTSILDETRIETVFSHNTNTVVTDYNPQTITGVWLASDTERTGVNYYTGGSILNIHSNYYYLNLGSPLPAENTEVVVEYEIMDGANAEDGIGVDRLSDFASIDTLYHEAYHVLSTNPKAQFSFRPGIGDAYVTGAYLPGYDIMSSRGLDTAHPLGGSMGNMPLQGGYTRQAMGWVTPLTLDYGMDMHNIQLISPTHATDGTTPTLVKIPLRPAGDPGLASLNSGDYYDFAGLSTDKGNNNLIRGQEYLLLEYRSAEARTDGNFNFDSAIPAQGVIAYHVVEANPFRNTTHFTEIIRQIDATSEGANIFNNVDGSLAAFGVSSGILSFSSETLWQEKPTTADTHTLEHLISEGQGEKTLYLRYADAQGTIVGSQTLTLTLDSTETAEEREPVVTQTVTNGYYQGAKRFIVDYLSPNGMKDIRMFIDGQLFRDDDDITSTQGQYIFTVDTREMSDGTHLVETLFTDGALNQVLIEEQLIIGTPVNQAPTADAGVDQSIVDTDNDGTESVTLDGSGSSDSDGTIAAYDWTKDGTTIATGQTATVDLPVGASTITLTVTDDDGATSSDTVSITVTEPVPPVILSQSVTTIDKTSAAIEVTVDTPVTVEIDYGISASELASTATSSSLQTQHTIPLSGLNSGTLYYYQVQVFDTAGISATSDIASFTTKGKPSGGGGGGGGGGKGKNK